jgi:hypothetical protein
MSASIACQLECPRILEFSLTVKYLVAAAQAVIVHSLQCAQWKREKGQVCPNHHDVFEMGLIGEAQCHPKSNLLLTASQGAPGNMGLWDLEAG